MQILAENQQMRIVRRLDGSLSPQERESGFWFTCYYADGWPVIVADTPAGRHECEAWTGLTLSAVAQ